MEHNKHLNIICMFLSGLLLTGRFLQYTLDLFHL